MHHVLRAFFQNARKPGGLSGRIMLWAMNWGHASLAKWGRSHVSLEPDARVLDTATERLGEKLVGLDIPSVRGRKGFQVLVPVRYSLKDA